MLTFFRRIRKGLLSEGATSKYLLYATGEILLVMIGILLALQVNNWNEWRKAHRFEDDLLTELRNTIIYDYSSIETVLEGNGKSRTSCQILLSHFDQNLPYHDSLNYHFWKANHWWQLNLRATAFENAKSYGLHFIKNDSLRMLLTSLYENDVLWWDDIDGRLALYQFNVIEPYILGLFEATALNSEMIPQDYKALRIDQKYRTILKTNIGNRDWFEMIVKHRFLEKLTALDKGIVEEIESR